MESKKLHKVNKKEIEKQANVAEALGNVTVKRRGCKCVCICYGTAKVGKAISGWGIHAVASAVINTPPWIL
ncbi:hypothetical protein CG709_02885 [Lachnotalea glycerini]|nr:hypothetical protein CG709_02885 [Lachnotalea glycerini]